MKKAFIIFLLLVLITSLYSCKCDDEKYFRLTGMTSVVGYSFSGDSINGIPEKKLFINIDFLPHFYSNNCNYNFSLINSAYAFSKCPGDGYDGCKEFIRKIDIRCSSDFDSIHHANDTINSLFTVGCLFCQYDLDTSSTNLNYFKDVKIPYFNIHPILVLEKPPTIDSIQQFTIELFMSNDEVFTTQTDQIIIE